MPVLDARKLNKRLGDRVLLAEIDLTIVRGEKVGVVGCNGAGKSTLARILAGSLEPDSGEISRRRGTRAAYLEQDPQFPGRKTVRDTVLAGREAWFSAFEAQHRLATELEAAGLQSHPDLVEQHAQALSELERYGGWEAALEADKYLSALGLSRPTQTLDTLSGGERRRVALARLLFAAPDLAILDEPTNHLDAGSVEWLERYLAEEFRGAVVLITHDRWLLNQVVDRTIEVDRGRLFSSSGGWEAYLVARAERLQREQREEQNRQNFLRQEIEWLRRQPKARTGKQKARVDRAEEALGKSSPRAQADLSLTLGETRLGSTILEARHLTVTVGGRTLVRDLSLQLTKRSRLGILGPSGAGKTTLIRTLLGELPPSEGQVTLGKTAQVAYLDQQRSGLEEEDTVMHAITGGQPTVTVGETTMGSHSYLERFHFRGDAARQKVGGLSGGERARVALARLLQTPANVLVLDEPTNDLDVMTLGALEELILGLSGVAIIVSHDRYFIDRVATQVVALHPDGTTIQVAGGFSEYAEHMKRREAQLRVAFETGRRPPGGRRADAEPDANAKTRAAPRKLSYAEQKELSGLLERVEEAAGRVEALEADLASPELYAESREKAAKMQAEYEQAKQELASLEERWLSLEERREAHA